MTTEELALRYSYGIIEDWSEFVERVTENNLIIKLLSISTNSTVEKSRTLPEKRLLRETT